MNWVASSILGHRGTFLRRDDGGFLLLQQFQMEFSLKRPDGTALKSPDAAVVAYWLNEAGANPTGIAVDITRSIVDQFKELRKSCSQ